MVFKYVPAKLKMGEDLSKHSEEHLLSILKEYRSLTIPEVASILAELRIRESKNDRMD